MVIALSSGRGKRILVDPKSFFFVGEDEKRVFLCNKGRNASNFCEVSTKCFEKRLIILKRIKEYDIIQ